MNFAACFMYFKSWTAAWPRNYLRRAALEPVCAISRRCMQCCQVMCQFPLFILATSLGAHCQDNLYNSQFHLLKMVSSFVSTSIDVTAFLEQEALHIGSWLQTEMMMPCVEERSCIVQSTDGPQLYLSRKLFMLGHLHGCRQK